MIGPEPGRWGTVALGVAGLLGAAALYTLLSWMQQAGPGGATIPGWAQLADAARQVVTPRPISGERWLLADAAVTFGRLGRGLLAGTAVGLTLGLLMGAFGIAHALLNPLVSAAAKLPPTAMLAAFFVLVGTGGRFFTATIAFGIAPILAASVSGAIRNDLPLELIQKARTLGASVMELLVTVSLPQILPRVLEAVRLQIGPAMVFLIAAEVAVGSEGFGYRIRQESRKVEFDVVYLYLGVLVLAGFAMDYLLLGARRLLSPWWHRSR